MAGFQLLLLTLLLTTAAGFSPEIKRLDVPSCNEVTLVCRVLTAEGNHVSVENSQFYANNTNVKDLLTGTEFDDSVKGVIRFTLRQELEATYTCRNDSSASTNFINLITCPTRDSVDRYYAVAVGQEVSLECGVKQGALASYYHPVWKKGFTTVDTTTPGSLYQLQRKELKDFTLTFLNPNPSDSGMYFCDVVTGQEDETMTPVEDGSIIELLVYEKPVITHMTGDITTIIHHGELKNITFICNATGSPDLTVSWYHNRERVVSNQYYSIYQTPRVGAVSSRLIMRVPKLTDSGNMTCKADINFMADSSSDSRSTETHSIETTRNIIILDTSPSVTVTVTQKSDLLVKISLGGIVLHQPLKLYFNFTENNWKSNIELKPDSTYSGVSTIYHSIPASQVPNDYRKFWLQVALVVENKVGPYNPPVLTSHLITDLDDQNNEEKKSWSTTEIIAVAVAAACSLITCVVACAITCICINVCNKKTEDSRRKSKGEKFAQVQKTVRHLNALLVFASDHEEQVSFLKEQLNSLQEHTGRLADDGAEENGAVANDGGEEVDSQRVLADCIERLKEIALSEFTRKLEEMSSKISLNPTAITGNGENTNGHQSQNRESTV